MRADLIARLKAMGADDRKIRSLVEAGFNEQQIEQIISHMYERSVVKAAVYGPIELVRYKQGAKMSKFSDYDMMDIGYDVLNAIKDKRGMITSTEAAAAAVTLLLDIEAGRATVEQDGTRFKARYKQASYTPALAGALRAALTTAGEAAVIETLNALAATSGNGRETMTSSGPQSVATKAAQRDPYAQAVQTGPPRGWRPN